MSGSGRETLPDFRERSGDHPGCPGVISMPSRMFGSGLEAVPDVREWSGGRPGCPSGLETLPKGGSPFWMSGNCQEALSVDREWSEDPPG